METGKTYSGFRVDAVQSLPELDARMFQMEHVKSGARLVWLDRKDENKTFGIAFRTLPENDTGVFHILEHSVLCGSERFPVKEPFVNLMQSSMQTYLNAMTFPDKTFYPVSSRNAKDFLNLMRVYMDAVLHPLIYSKPEIFRQEGWHFEMPQDGGEPSYKGVVFNEMKGAFASPDALMQNMLCRQLFPDTSYRFVSGGDPAHIPELTYESFLDCHRRFYHPSNSYIYLDGEMDIENILSILDGEFLSAYDRLDGQPQFVRQQPVKSSPVKVPYEISANEQEQERAWLVWGCVLGSYDCREELMAVRVMSDALCGSNESPLKQKLLSAGLAQDVFIGVMDGLYQPFVMLGVRNMDASRAGEVESAVREVLEQQVRLGLDHQQLAATLANMEFQMRERDYGSTPQGLGLGMEVMGSWLYGGNPAANLEVGGLFASLNKKLEEGWFEALLERVFLNSNHSCRILLTPSKTLGEENRAAEAERLQAASRAWSAQERSALEQQQARLDEWQGSEDTPEALSKLPALHLSDIPVKPEAFPTEVGKLGGAPLLRHRLPTSGVGYVSLYFDVSDLNEKQLSSLSFLCSVLSELDTEKYGSLELQRLQRLLLGGVNFYIDSFGKVNDPHTCWIYLTVSFSALEAKLEDAAALIAEIITATKFDDSRRIRDILRQCSTEMEHGVSSAGHSFAVTRIAAGHSAEGAVREYAGGISYCQWLKEMVKTYDENAAALASGLKGLCEKIFDAGRLTIGVTGVEDSSCAALEKALLPRLPASSRQELRCTIQPWGVRREGIVIPADISFAALGGNLLAHGLPYSGKVRIAARIASLVYLWNTIRVQGGAYGTGLSCNDSGNTTFYSYRDPNAARSLGCYRQMPEFLSQFCASGPDLTGLIIGAVAESDPLMLPSRKGRTADGLYLRGISYEDRCQRREEMLSVDAGALASMAEAFRQVGQQGGVCVIGSEKQLKECGEELDTIIRL